MEDVLSKTIESVSFINEKINCMPEVAIILGSGMGAIADAVTDRVEIPYEDIPNFPSSTVEGHSNKLVIGKIYNKNVIVMQGRFHYYEGYSIDEIAFPIKVFAMLGVSKLIVTNAAGGLNKKFKVGDVMLITDHINISGLTPLRGPNVAEFGERFPSMTNAYSSRLIEITKKIASKIEPKDYDNSDEDLEKMLDELSEDKKNTEKTPPIKITLRDGVYAFMPGPQYETKAETKMLTTLGADGVGMSTVPEVISAVHSGMEVLGMSCITNLCFSNTAPNHKEVLDATKSAEKYLKILIMGIVKDI